MTLKSEFGEVERVEPFVKELQESFDFTDDTFGNVMLCLSECVTNAILHGNKEDPDKQVHVNAWREDDLLKISIQDEGSGFDPDKLPNPLDQENLMKEGGRGVYLIRQYSDDVNFSEGGTKITIEFHLKS